MKLPLLKLTEIILGPILRVIFRMKIIGEENLPEGGYIIACNHQNWIDAYTLGAALRLRRFWCMAKEELFHNKLLAFYIRHMGCFPVNRGHGDTTAITTAENLVRNKEILVIFPEGTRSKTGVMGRVKPGVLAIAAACQAPVVPCYMTYPVLREKAKPRWFRKTIVQFGKPLSLNDLFGEDYVAGEKPVKLQYREGCDRLSNEMQTLKREDLL